jgi:glucose dehydrogenase
MFARPSLISIVVLAGLIPIAHIGRRQPETAQILWQFAVIGSGTRVFAYTIGGDLIALDLESGKPEWSYDLKAAGWESPAARR